VHRRQVVARAQKAKVRADVETKKAWKCKGVGVCSRHDLRKWNNVEVEVEVGDGSKDGHMHILVVL
jgi:hypothetical protein